MLRNTYSSALGSTRNSSEANAMDLQSFVWFAAVSTFKKCKIAHR
jgi:hypothetical protein